MQAVLALLLQGLGCRQAKPGEIDLSRKQRAHHPLWSFSGHKLCGLRGDVGEPTSKFVVKLSQA